MTAGNVTRIGNFARLRAEREAEDLARQIAAEARAYLAGDRQAAYDLHRLSGQLAVLVMDHALDLEAAV